MIGVPDARWGESVRAVVVPRPGDDHHGGRADPVLSRSARRFQCPRGVTFLEALPRTANGKVLKRALRETYWTGQERRVGGAA